MKLSMNETLMVGAIGEADGAHDGYSKATHYGSGGDVPELWISLVWISDDFAGYYLKRTEDGNDFTIEWRNLDHVNDKPDKMHVITLTATTWQDTAKILAKAIKCHKKWLKM